MSLVYYNPYSQLGQQLKDGLDAIIGELPPPPPDPTVEQLINEVIGYVGPLYGDTGGEDLGPIINLELSILLSATLNGYINSASGSPVRYDRRQQEFIFQLVEGILAVPVVGVRDRILNIEENIATSGLNSEQQAPLLMATAVGKASWDYWAAQSGGGSPWQPYLNHLIDAHFLVFATSAAMEGALLGAKLMGAKTTKLGTISLDALNAISALSSSLLLAAGKVMLRWQPRVATNHRRPGKPQFPIVKNPNKEYPYSCADGTSGVVDADNDQQANDLMAVIGSIRNTTCSLDVA